MITLKAYSPEKRRTLVKLPKHGNLHVIQRLHTIGAVGENGRVDLIDRVSVAEIQGRGRDFFVVAVVGLAMHSVNSRFYTHRQPQAPAILTGLTTIHEFCKQRVRYAAPSASGMIISGKHFSGVGGDVFPRTRSSPSPDIARRQSALPLLDSKHPPGFSTGSKIAPAHQGNIHGTAGLVQWKVWTCAAHPD